jgi:hypothetical protein
VIVGTFVAGILLVCLSLLASRPLVTAIRRGTSRRGRQSSGEPGRFHCPGSSNA